jgi:hypothetical protein
LAGRQHHFTRDLIETVYGRSGPTDLALAGSGYDADTPIFSGEK